MDTRIYSTDGSQYQNPGFGRTAAGVVAGATAFSATSLASLPLGIVSSKRMQAAQKGLNADAIRIGLNQALETSGVKNAGVKIFDLKSYATDTLNNAPSVFGGVAEPSKMAGKLNAKPTRLKSFIDKIMEYANPLEAVKSGKNAFYNTVDKGIYINTEKIGLAGFHEIGHSINANSSKFWGKMQKMRKFSLFAPLVIGAIAISKRKKAEGEEPNGVLDKVTTFIKNNAGKLTIASMLPMLAEELKATARGECSS